MPLTAFCSVGPHCFLLKNPSLYLVWTALIQLSFSWCCTACSMHQVTHTEKVTQCLWLTSKEKLLFLLRRNLKRLLFGKFHAFIKPNLGKSWFCNIEINAVFKKEKSITASPSFDPDLWQCTVLCYPFKENNYFTVCDCKILPNTVCFCNFTFRLIEISIAAQNLAGQCRELDQTLKKRFDKKPYYITGFKHPHNRLHILSLLYHCVTISSIYQETCTISVFLYLWLRWQCVCDTATQPWNMMEVERKATTLSALCICCSQLRANSCWTGSELMVWEGYTLLCHWLFLDCSMGCCWRINTAWRVLFYT